VVVNIEWKNTKHEDAHRSERRSALINSLTEPTLLEMYGKRVYRDLSKRLAPFQSTSAATNIPTCSKGQLDRLE
jgi:hypothetical protein